MHLICFCGGIYIAISLHGSEIGKIFIKQCILYVFLLQTMFPKYCTAINAVEWTLSVLVICFFLTPFIVKLLPYLCKNNMSFAGIYILQLIYIFIFRNSASFIWFCGVAPFFRILDYIQGCMLAYLIMNGRIKPSNKFEIQSFIIYVFVVFVVAPKIENVFAWSLLFTPLSLCLINCFYSDCGFMSKYIFKFPIFQKLGSISFEFYMVHKLILEFWSQYIVNYILWGILSFGTAILVVVLYRHFLRVFTIS